jgi:hypothetical protein
MAQHSARDLVKERFWRRILRLWRQTRPASVRGFCVEQGVTEALFYAWRRTITDRDRQRRNSSRPLPVHQADGQPLFVPVAALPSTTAACTPAALELVLGSGHVVRVPAGFDAAALRQLLAVLEEKPSC